MPRFGPRKLLLTAGVLSCMLIFLAGLQVWSSPDLSPALPPEPAPLSSQASNHSRRRPWFMTGGGLRPTHQPNLPLWPEDDPDSDRIVNQLMWVPPDYDAVKKSGKLKKILLFFGRGGWHDLPLGRTKFLQDRCPVSTCELSTDLDHAESADAIFFKDRFSWPSHRRSPNQVWILFLLECPLNTQGFSNLPHVFNWTATYRHDSDIVAPYEKFVAYPDPPNDNPANSAEQKSKKVAWFVSNCAARNRRLQFARELANHIEVDIYGTCGQKRCPRTQATRCFDMLDRDYKFYLAFENSNCRDYITEKFFVNGLGQDVVPIVMGAHPEDYKRSSPPHSYIHVDDFQSPKELAAYLKVLDANATRYREYFKWKRTGEFINTYFWCRLCAMLHAPKTKSYDDLHSWWAGPGQCTSQHWQNL